MLPMQFISGRVSVGLNGGAILAEACAEQESGIWSNL